MEINVTKVPIFKNESPFLRNQIFSFFEKEAILYKKEVVSSTNRHIKESFSENRLTFYNILHCFYYNM